MNNIKQIIFALPISILMYSCSPASNDFPGSEYVPDMAHSVAVEANAYDYYYLNTWDEESTISLWELVKNPGQPVAGTVPRGYAGGGLGAAADMDVVLGNDNVSNIRIKPNGFVPYYYENTEESRLLASAEITDNPFPITAAGLAEGKEMYNIYCSTCHGVKADGLGYLYDTDANPNAKYLAAPANLINETFTAASNGQLYHAIMYGKNVMGSYADKLSYEERWQVIHYLRSLQAKNAGAIYNEDVNTFNSTYGTPGVDFMLHVDHGSDLMMDDEMHNEVDHTDGAHQTDEH